MRGLHGCTAVIILSNNGFWAAHFWEVGTFKKKVGDGEYVLYDDATFKRLAVDILPNSFDGFQGLQDLPGDPFQADVATDIVVFTRSAVGKPKVSEYDSKIRVLSNALRQFVSRRPAPVRQTYRYIPRTNDEMELIYNDNSLLVRGTISIQYDPAQARVPTNGQIVQVAAVKVWAQTEPAPLIQRTWLAGPSQGVVAATNTPAATPTTAANLTTATNATTATITSTPTPSCVLHNEDPDQGVNQAYCLCDQTITLSPLPASSAQSESCAYNSIPATSARATVTTQTEVWTVNCAACTLAGGFAGQQTCTTGVWLHADGHA